MPRKMASATIAFGMAKIPVGIASASSKDSLSLKSVCDECGGVCSYMEDDDGNKVQCGGCGKGFSWWNQVPLKGYELGDDIIPLDADDVSAAREEPPVETGNVEKVVEVGQVHLHYNVEGNYYLLPEEDFEDQYGALVGSLNAEGLAILTYLQLRSKTQRYAIISRGGVLLALQLQDKKALPELEYGTDENLERQATSMLQSMTDDDPALEDVEGQGIKELVTARVEEQEPEPVAPEAE